MDKVKQLLQRDAWAASEGDTDDGPFILRFRTPILQPGEAGRHAHRLVVCWPYALEGSGAMPNNPTGDSMAIFEDRLCGAWENDCLAVLAAVLTFDGARQWVYYTHDVAECGRRLNEMPQESDPYPIELTTETDPNWNYLRDRVLARVNWHEHQEGWQRPVSESDANGKTGPSA